MTRAPGGETSSPSQAVPGAVTAVAGPVERRLAEVLAAERARWAEVDPALDRPLVGLEELVLGGGKRLRPVFCFWGHRAAGGHDDAGAIELGAAVEILHAFALLHDDVMDRSPTRRGRPTVHHQLTEEHRRAGWRGDPLRYGESVAIVLGDLAHVIADRLVVGPPPVHEVWDQLRLEVNAGQLLDLHGGARGAVSLEEARRIARYKSGRYTVERPLHLGAALTGRLAPVGAVLSAYGDPLGEAFQLRDDLLGAFGDEARTGKPVGDDLREGKPTPLLAVAVERVRGDRRHEALLARVGADDLDPDTVAEVQELLRRCGAVDEIEGAIARLRHQAIDALGAPGSPLESHDDVVDALVELAHYVTDRQA